MVDHTPLEKQKYQELFEFKNRDCIMKEPDACTTTRMFSTDR